MPPGSGVSAQLAEFPEHEADHRILLAIDAALAADAIRLKQQLALVGASQLSNYFQPLHQLLQTHLQQRVSFWSWQAQLRQLKRVHRGHSVYHHLRKQLLRQRMQHRALSLWQRWWLRLTSF